jgi:glycosyltransferase involved in cell wall biosynthesis
MQEDASAMRVVMVFGGPPQDAAHLEVLGSLVDLTVYGSAWDPNRGARQTFPSSSRYRARTFVPFGRPRRGHLHYVFPGLRRALREDAPDVIHVMPEPWGLLTQQTLVACRGLGATVVLHACDNIWHHGSRIEQRVRRALAGHALGRANGLAAENPDAIQIAHLTGLSKDKPTAVIHTNPRDPSTFRFSAPEERSAARRTLGITSALPTVGMVGRIAAEKGVSNFVEAIGALNAHRRVVQGVIIGGWPPEFEGLHAAAEQRGIVCAGSVTYPAGVANALRALDVICVPSIDTPVWKEQGPRIVIEAMLAGVAVVASDTPGIRQLAGGHALLVEPDPHALAAGVREALADREDGASQRHRAYAIDRFGPVAVATQLHRLWSEANDGGPTELGPH